MKEAKLVATVRTSEHGGRLGDAYAKRNGRPIAFARLVSVRLHGRGCAFRMWTTCILRKLRTPQEVDSCPRLARQLLPVTG